MNFHLLRVVNTLRKLKNGVGIVSSQIIKTIRGNDLRKMRIHSGLTSQEMADHVNVKSRKTIENWERDFCEPTIGAFVLFCLKAGFNPGLVVAEIQKRNRADPTQQTDIDLGKCLISK